MYNLMLRFFIRPLAGRICIAFMLRFLSDPLRVEYV
jgi:hypothetical protein